MSTNTYLSTRELAARWSLKPATLLAWRGKGLGPRYVKLGGVIRYSMAEIIDYEAAGAIGRKLIDEGLIDEGAP